MIYYFLFSIFLVFSFSEIVFKIKKNNLLIGLFTLFLIFFAGTRWLVGTDFTHYQKLYEIILSGQAVIGGLEDSYQLISKLFSNFKIVLLFYAFSAVLLKVLFIRESKYPYTTFMLYFSFTYLSYDMGRMRQGLALAICIFSVFYIFKRKLFKFTICMILAFLVHKPAIIFSVVYLLAKVRINKKFMMITALLSVICSFLHIDYYFEIVMHKIPIISSYADYFTTGSEFFGFSFSISNFRRILLLILFIFMIDYENKRNRVYINSFYIGTLIFYVFKDFPVISERIGYYFCCFDIFLIPLCISNKKLWCEIGSALLIGLYGFYYFYNIIHISEDDIFNKPYLPYKSSISFLTDSPIYTLIIVLSVIILFVVIFNFKNIKKSVETSYNSVFKKKKLMR